MKNRKWIIVSGSIGVLAIFIAISLFMSPTVPSTTTQNEDTPSNIVIISSLKAHTDDLNLSRIDAIQTTLYGITAAAEPTPDSSYTGTIRDGSYKKVSEDNGYTVSFITDIAAIKKSWRVEYTVSNTGNDGSTPVIISCLEPNELRYEAFECKDFYDQ